MPPHPFTYLILALLPLFGASPCHAQTRPADEPTAAAYTMTLADKRGIALPPHVLRPLPKAVTVRVRLTTPGSGGPAIRLVGVPGTGEAGFGFDAVLTLDGSGVPRDCRATFGPRPAMTGATPATVPYAAEIHAARQPGGGDAFRLTLPARTGRSVAGAPVLHPLAAQLFIGRQYDFGRGGPQTFALLQDWDGDALSPLSDLATLRLEARGPARVTLEGGEAEARRLEYTLSAVSGSAPPRTGTLFVGPRGELLQATPALFGIPFDGGRAKKPAEVEDGVVVLRTDKGETIKGKRRPDGGYDVELYGKYDYPFATATLDAAGRFARISERWNGRERVSAAAPNEVRYSFSVGELGTVPTTPERAWFLAHWFATGTWEDGAGPFARMPVGGKQDGTFLPLILSGEYGRPFTLERLTDLRASAGGAPPLRRYRVFLDAGAVRYDLYTDGQRLVHLSGTDGLTITRDGSEAFAASAKQLTR
jgi:hypothetical protein